MKISIVATFALLLVCGLLPALRAAEPATGVKPAEPKSDAIDRLIIIVHPCPYEIYHKPAPGSKLWPYRAMEQDCFAGWLEAAKKLPATAFVVQIDMPNTAPGPDQLFATCVARLGAERVCRVKGEYQYPEKPLPLLDYYKRIHAMLTEQFAKNHFTFDPAKCETELWGQSFEGCAPGYGTAVSRRLGLQKPFRFDYGKSVPDAPFLLKARYVDTVTLPESDVVAYLFDLEDGSHAALLQARKQDQWLDHRPIEFSIDPARFWVSTKTDQNFWPADKVAAGAQSVRMMASEEHFLRTRGTNASMDDLKAVLAKARVGAAPKESRE